MVTRREMLMGTMGVACAALAGGRKGAAAAKRDPALTAFLSDCHVGAWHSPDYQGRKFAACIARVLALDPLPARMIIPGDLAYLWGRKEDYALAKKLLEPVVAAGIEVTIGMGNHDRRENFLEFWPEYEKASPVPGRIVSVVKGPHLDYVMLDTLDEPPETDRWITPGVLDDAQRAWLRDFCRAAKRPFLVCAHHPAIELGATGKKGSHACARDFGALLMGGDKEPPTRCRGFIHGHDHEWYVTRNLFHWSKGRIGHTAALPSTGHWGDIGYALLREEPDRATLSLVQYDFFTPKPLPKGAKPRADWEAIVRDNANARCTFI